MRVNKSNYYLDIAETVLERSTCIRRHFGAVIVNNDRIISTGYNGSISGDVNCCDRNYCMRNELNCETGKGYEHCIAIHAEQNAILNITRQDALGSSIFLVGIDVNTTNYFPVEPCYICIKLIKAIGVKKIYIRESKQLYKEIDI
jgi:dCMP deaminase